MGDADFKTLWGSACSKSAYKRRCLEALMDTTENAQKRMEEREAGQKKKIHVSLDYTKMEWDWNGLVEEARTWEKGSKNKLASNSTQVQCALRHRQLQTCCQWRSSGPSSCR